MSFTRVLVANRGEIALRLSRGVADAGLTPVALYSTDEADALHVRRAEHAAALPAHGVRAYLDQHAVIAAAQATNCDAIHPGYGFLAENGEFAAACAAAGLRFIGPTPAQLKLFGDKLAARALAARCGVPVLDASGALPDAAALQAFQTQLGPDAALILKAAAGGGGRGMQVLAAGVDAASALTRCQQEAAASFGDGTIYAERFIATARHIEVQVLGDGQGGVTHFRERDCSLQRRHQKVIEIAPAPHLDPALLDRVLDAALTLAREVRYLSLGTFEFLVDVAANAFYFIEANPRLQVEHTITEEILGCDLVGLQLAVAAGATLETLGLITPPPAPVGYAIQLRVNAETVNAEGVALPAGGVITAFDPPGGPGVRLDTAAFTGLAINPNFDSLLAKLIVRSSAPSFAAAVARAERAAAEFAIAGPATNLGWLRAILRMPQVGAAQFTTRLVEQAAAALAEAAGALVPAAAALSVTGDTRATPTVSAPAGQIALLAPMRGSVVSIDVVVGAQVARGTPIATLEAMKMHHLVEAASAGIVMQLLAAPGETLADGAPIAFLAPLEDAGLEARETVRIDLDAARADLDEVRALHRFTEDAARPLAVAKRRRTGSRTARENVADLLDADSLIEYGALIVAAQRRRRSLEDLRENTPADGMVAGIGTVNADWAAAERARCLVLAYDYTVLAGTQGVFNHKKKDRLFALAKEWALPVVFYTEGGGGRPGDVDVDDVISCWLDLPTFATWPQLSGGAPRIAVNSGRCYAGNAVLFGCADITIATANSNIGLAGPAMIEGGGLGKFTPEDIGPMDVQTRNGVVDIAVADEAEATAVTRQLLGVFQGPQPVWACADQRLLRHAVPENRLRVYDVRTVIHTLADTGSVIELRPHYGVGLITCFIRVEGQAFGLIANDPRHLGGAIDSEGGEKGGRFLQLCEAYGVPVVSLCDTPGYMVGPDSEKTAAVRRGSRLIMASANLTVPLFTVVLRKGYGLGAQAMAGGSFHRPFFSIAWPTAEFGPMGLEGAVNLGYRKELEAETDPAKRQALYEQLLAMMYTRGKAVSVASQMEIDAVIDPAETRQWLTRGLRSAGPRTRRPYPLVDVW